MVNEDMWSKKRVLDKKIFWRNPPDFNLSFQMALTDFENSIVFDFVRRQQVGHLKNAIFQENRIFSYKKDFLKIFFAAISEIKSCATFL